MPIKKNKTSSHFGILFHQFESSHCYSFDLMMTSRKPDTCEAMKQLLNQIREVMPFQLTQAQICSGECIGCSKKLLEFITLQLEEWDTRLEQGETPKLGDLQKLAKTSKKIYHVFEKNGLVNQ